MDLTDLKSFFMPDKHNILLAVFLMISIYFLYVEGHCTVFLPSSYTYPPAGYCNVLSWPFFIMISFSMAIGGYANVIAKLFVDKFSAYFLQQSIQMILLLASYLLFFYAISCILSYLTKRYLKGKFKPTYAILLIIFILVAISAVIWPPVEYDYNGKNMQIMDTYCVGGNEGVILIRNTGTKIINVDDITVINTTSGSDPGGDWWDLNGTKTSKVNPGMVLEYNMSCKSFCLFRFLVGGRSMTAAVQC